jgi:hypothetical protein
MFLYISVFSSFNDAFSLTKTIHRRINVKDKLERIVEGRGCGII